MEVIQANRSGKAFLEGVMAKLRAGVGGEVIKKKNGGGGKVLSGRDEEIAMNSDLWRRNLSARPTLLISFAKNLLLKGSECRGNSLFVCCYKYLFIYILL